MPPQSRKHKETIDDNETIDRWRQEDISADAILFQLHLRGIQLTEDQEEEQEMGNLKLKVKVKRQLKRSIHEIMLNG